MWLTKTQGANFPQPFVENSEERKKIAQKASVYCSFRIFVLRQMAFGQFSLKL